MTGMLVAEQLRGAAEQARASARLEEAFAAYLAWQPEGDVETFLTWLADEIEFGDLERRGRARLAALSRS